MIAERIAKRIAELVRACLVLALIASGNSATAEAETASQEFERLVAQHVEATGLDAAYTLNIYTQAGGLGTEPPREVLVGIARGTLRLAKPTIGSGRIELEKNGRKQLALELRGDAHHWYTLNRRQATYQRVAADLDGLTWTPQLSVFRAWSGEARAQPLTVTRATPEQDTGWRTDPLEDGWSRIRVEHQKSEERYLVDPSGLLREAQYSFRTVNAQGIQKARYHYVFERWQLLGADIDTSAWISAPPAGYEEFNANWNVTRKLIAPGKPFPDVRLTFIDGHAEQLTELRGKTVVLGFWFIGCMPCRRELPELQELSARYAERDDVVFICPNVSDLRPAIETFWYPLEYDNLVPAMLRGPELARCKVKSFPSLYVIDPAGRVALRSTGFDPQSSMLKIEQAIERATASQE